MGRLMDVVTGASGFVGPHLVRALIERGSRVRCIVRPGARVEELRLLGADVQRASLLDPEPLAALLQNANRVFHLAGGGAVSAMTEHGLAALREANVDLLRAVLRAAEVSGVKKLVHFSSISAMGVQLDVRLSEDSPCLAKTPHEIAKLESEQVALDAWKKHGVPVVVLRPAQIYGPGDVRSEIPRLVRLARRGLVPLFGRGEGRVPWVYVSDVVDAAIAAAERPEAVGRTYIVSDAESYRFADVVTAIAGALGRRRGGFIVPDALASAAISGVEVVARLFGKDPPFTRHRLSSISGKRLLSIDRAQRELGYAPRVALHDGIDRTVRWYTDNRVA
jgi:nucleoside-diphosphate-sugar epimerase